MAKSPVVLLLLGFVGLVALLPFPSAATATAGSIHDLLRAHGLPGGLLPLGIESFSLNRSSGVLEVRLERPCYARYDGMVLFDSVVRANLTYGGLHALVGVSQEELFLWLPVRAILVSDPASGVVLFDIGVAHKQISLSLFESPPECRPPEEGGSGGGGEETTLGAGDGEESTPKLRSWQ